MNAKQRNWPIRFAWGFVIIGFLLGIAGAWIILADGKLDSSSLSALGSYLQGAVASIWSLAGLLFVYAAFASQKEQLAKQDQEIEEQRKQFKQQHDSIKQQNFESSFFQLLSLHNQVTSELRTILSVASSTNVPKKLDGKGVFEDLHFKFRELYDLRMKVFMLVTPQPLSDAWEEVFNKLHEDQRLSHYFLTLYHIIKFVSKSDTPNRRQYTSLVRAQLSAYELVFLFYNGISKHGINKQGKMAFKDLIEQFGLLEHLDATLLLKTEHKALYDQKAFE